MVQAKDVVLSLKHYVKHNCSLECSLNALVAQ